MLFSVLKPYQLINSSHRRKKLKVFLTMFISVFFSIFYTLRITAEHAPSLPSPMHTSNVLCFRHAMRFKGEAVIPFINKEDINIAMWLVSDSSSYLT